MIGRLRGLAKRVPFLVKVAQERRSRETVQQYVRQREHHAARPRRPLSPVGDAEARRALAHRWTGARRALEFARDARIFCATVESETVMPIAPELRRAFDTVAFDAAPYLPAGRGPTDPSWRDRLQRDLVAAFASANETAPVDLAFLYLNTYHVDPDTLRAITATGVPAAVLALDDKHKYASSQRPLVAATTVCLSNSLESLRWYAADGGVGYYFPEASDPEIFQHLDLTKDLDVTFVGGWYGGRRRLIGQLRSLGIRVNCFGPQTENGPVSRDEMVRIFNRSRLNLGFGGVGETELVTTLKARDFDVPMTGGAYLTVFDWELADMFAVGSEILCYRNDIDCAEQIRALLEDPARGQRLGAAARERALRDHTWTRRFSDLLSWLGIVAPAT